MQIGIVMSVRSHRYGIARGGTPIASYGSRLNSTARITIELAETQEGGPRGRPGANRSVFEFSGEENRSGLRCSNFFAGFYDELITTEALQGQFWRRVSAARQLFAALHHRLGLVSCHISVMLSS